MWDEMARRRDELVSRRRLQGHTQETLAHRLGVDVSTVARWERGTTLPSPAMRRDLARELDVSMEELAALLTERATRDPELITSHWTDRHTDDLVNSLTSGPPFGIPGDTAARTAHQWLLTDPPEDITAGLADDRQRRIGATTIGRIRDRIQRLRYVDDVLPGGDFHRIAQAELASTSELLRRCRYSDQVGRDLLAEIAELCELAGWSTADAGHDAAAEHYYLRGISAAHAAGDAVLAAHLVSGLAYHRAEVPRTGEKADAVLLARSALARATASDRPWLTPTVRALLHARLAWAHARSGAPDAAAEEMGRAVDEYARRKPDDPNPSWVYWLSAEEMDIIIGRCDTATGHPDRARRRLDHALRTCDPRYAREYTLYTTWLADACLATGDLTSANELAERARVRAASLGSTFGHRAVTGLTRRLAACG